MYVCYSAVASAFSDASVVVCSSPVYIVVCDCSLGYLCVNKIASFSSIPSMRALYLCTTHPLQSLSCRVKTCLVREKKIIRCHVEYVDIKHRLIKKINYIARLETKR